MSTISPYDFNNDTMFRVYEGFVRSAIQQKKKQVLPSDPNNVFLPEWLKALCARVPVKESEEEALLFIDGLTEIEAISREAAETYKSQIHKCA